MDIKIRGVAIAALLYGFAIQDLSAETLDSDVSTGSQIEKIYDLDSKFEVAVRKDDTQAAASAIRTMMTLEDDAIPTPLERSSLVQPSQISLLFGLLHADAPETAAEFTGLLYQLQNGKDGGSMRETLVVKCDDPVSLDMMFLKDQPALVYARSAPLESVFLKITDVSSQTIICDTKRNGTRALCKWEPSMDQRVQVSIYNEAEGALEVTLLTN